MKLYPLCYYILQDGRTALMFASERGESEIVKCMIDAKANLDLQSKQVSLDNWFKFKAFIKYIFFCFIH